MQIFRFWGRVPIGTESGSHQSGANCTRRGPVLHVLFHSAGRDQGEGIRGVQKSPDEH